MRHFRHFLTILTFCVKIDMCLFVDTYRLNKLKGEKMTPIQEKIVNAVEQAGGSATWQQVTDALDYPEQQRALHEIRPLEQQGILKRIVARDPDTGALSFTVDKVG